MTAVSAMTAFAKAGGEAVSLVMAPNIKHLLGITGLLFVSLWYQGPLNATSYSLKEQRTDSSSPLLEPSVPIQRGLEWSALNARPVIRRDEFWLTESDSAVLPFDVEFVPPDESWGQTKPLWSCEDNTTRNNKIIFVNIVRTEAIEFQELLSSYASSCHAGFVSTVMCSGLSWESMKDTWANRRTRGSKSGVKCPLKGASIDRNGNQLPSKYVQASLLNDSVDMIAGQVPMGSHEQWKSNNEVVDVQYVVSLRSPFAWFISSIIDKVMLQEQSDQIEADIVIAAVKQKVEADLATNTYHEVYARYLITPSQISWIQKEEADLQIAHRVELALTNLKKHNALIIIAEEQAESLDKLEHLIDSDGHQAEAFAKARRRIADTKGGDPLLSKVLSSLKEDKEFFPQLQKYLKYESQLYDQAKSMHNRQMAWLQHKSVARKVSP